ncbi:hypothetical protein D9M69_636470 [compost metagenome]
MLKRKPRTCLVNTTGDTPIPIFLAENHRATRCLLNELRVPFVETKERSIANERAHVLLNHPDSPDD